MSARITLKVEPVREAVRLARHEIAGHFQLDPDLAADVDLVVSEFVANAIVHGTPPIEVTVTVEDETIRVEVHDLQPVMGLPTPDSRGLNIVAHLAKDWGVTKDGQPGKCVWAELAADTPAGPT